MDEYSGKRVGVFVPKRVSSIVLRNTDSTNQNGQFCNRIGCNGRINYVKGSTVGCSEKPRTSRPAFRSSGKEIVGSTSRSSSFGTNTRKSSQEPRRKVLASSSQLVTELPETSSVRDVLEVPDHTVPSPLRSENESLLDMIDVNSGEVTLIEVGSSSVPSSNRSQKILSQKSVHQRTYTGPNISSTSRNPRQGSSNSTNGSKCNLRNLRCNSVSDVLQQGCGAASDSNPGRRRDTLRKINHNGESSSSLKGKKMSLTVSSSDDGRISHSGNGLFISDSRRSRNFSLSRDKSMASVRTRRPLNYNTILRSSNPENENNLTSTESHDLIPQICRPEAINNPSGLSSSHRFMTGASSICLSSYSHTSGSDDGSANTTQTSSTDLGTTLVMNRDGMLRYNMDTMAEVLLALERIEQDEELTHEQLYALETNLFLSGFNFYDQHRDMRMNIDNMTYEELLALEERMGTVSTALSEDALSKCLKRSFYLYEPAKEDSIECSDGEDAKCSICQEEYVIGDEIGKLECEHKYHVMCIQEWLRLKNWCPICKGSAAPS